MKIRALARLVLATHAAKRALLHAAPKTALANVRASLVLAKAAIGYFIYNLQQSDHFSARDTERASLLKALQEAVGSADVLICEIEKELHENPILSESVRQETLKPLSDWINITGKLIGELGKALVDKLDISEKSTLAAAKGINKAGLVHDSVAYILLRSFLDDFSATESTSLNFTKVPLDQSLIDDNQILAMGKSLYETPEINDSARRNISIVQSGAFFVTDDLDGQSSALDEQIMSFFKLAAERAFLADDFSRIADYKRSPIDGIRFSGDLVRNAVKASNDFLPIADQHANAFVKKAYNLYGIDYFAEDYVADYEPVQAQDKADVTTAKSILELAGLINALTTKSSVKGVLDAAGLNDALIEHHAAKPIADWLPVSVLLQAGLYRPLNDLLSASESVSTGIEKSTQEEALQTSDALSYVAQYSRILADNHSITDDSWIESSKSIDDQAVISDGWSYAADYFRSLSDLFGGSDLVSVSGEKPLSDGASISDVLSRSVQFIRAYADAASADDLLSLSINRHLSDAPIFADSRISSLFKNPAESSQLSDNGGIMMQNYAEPGYFSADYVGTSFTF